MDKVKLALVGVGVIGKRHLKAITEVEQAELLALVDTDPRGAEIAAEWGVPSMPRRKQC